MPHAVAASSPTDPLATGRSPTHRGDLRRIAMLAVLVIGCVIACVVACRAMDDLKPILLIPPVTGVVGLTALRFRGQLDASVRSLRERVEQVRRGHEPIDSLAADPQAPEELRRLGEELRAILRELRQQRQRVAELNEEMRQRVANRTDALERVIGSLRQQASRDALTGLYNRRVMDRYLAEMLDRCRAEGLDLAVLMIDLDNFKPLNDTLGHQAGDALLRDVGRLIKSSIRDQDVAFRYGGDEFAIVLPGVGAEGAQALSRRLSSLVEGLTRTMKLARPPRLSVGIAHASESKDVTSADLLARADERLYAMKRAARLQSPPTSPAQPAAA